MGDLARVMSEIDYDDYERLKKLEAEWGKNKISPSEVEIAIDIRAGSMMVVPAHGGRPTQDTLQAVCDAWFAASKQPCRFTIGEPLLSEITADEAETIKKLRSGDIITIDADSITTGIIGTMEDPFLAYLLRTVEWSTRTFGPAARTAGIIQHMQKEIGEIEKSPYDLTEWIDMIKLAIDGYWRHGGNLHMLLELMCRKQSKNIARTWPDWRTMSENVAIEHDRTDENQTSI